MGLWQQSYLGYDGLESTILETDDCSSQRRKAIHIVKHLSMSVATRFDFYKVLLTEAISELNKVEELRGKVNRTSFGSIPMNFGISEAEDEAWSTILACFGVA